MVFADMVVKSLEERQLDWNDPNILAADLGPDGDLQNLL